MSFKKCIKCEVITEISGFSPNIKGKNKGELGQVCDKCKNARKLVAESNKIVPNPDNYKPDYRCFKCGLLVFEYQMHRFKSGKLTKCCTACKLK